MQRISAQETYCGKEQAGAGNGLTNHRSVLRGENQPPTRLTCPLKYKCKSLFNNSMQPTWPVKYKEVAAEYSNFRKYAHPLDVKGGIITEKVTGGLGIFTVKMPFLVANLLKM